VPCGDASQGEMNQMVSRAEGNQDSAGPKRQAFVFCSFSNILAPRHPSPPLPCAPKEAPGPRWATDCEDGCATHQIVQHRLRRCRR